ncbi:NucA/NucB deoxyribonuclease domain-containing protein [Streptomyces sp. AK08-02]|uniref:NucA/NucB deoxyribonuclease domain-containing protein n=1 Tax=Streptomyces sp. AK08-02 TaxID=3028654 RepID=UPI0029BC29BF|nr:NucA/NucB deoxyribonuclease domain-containing protein [Streptomyces sp. AK08-02]MDX3749634.1 NucA/NucB deoxyribonuclease domain-containing protein [Streptomyces sp. AK08-02]
MRPRMLLAAGAVTLGLLGSCLSGAQAADDPGTAPDTSVTTGVAAADPAADEPSLVSEAADDDPEAVPSAEDMALGIAGTVNEPAAAAPTEDPDTREASPEAVCNERVKAAAETPGAQYTACVSPLEPAGEISAEERAALSRSDAPDDTSASESAVLAAVPDAGAAGQEASAQETAEDSASESSPAVDSDASAAAAGRSPWKEPKWCRAEGVDSTWYIERLRGCGIWRSEVNAVDVRTGRKVGGIKYLFIGYSFTARDSKTWAYQVQLLEVSRWGRAVGGTRVSGSAYCTGKCKVTDSDFPSQAITSRADPYGQFFMNTTINTAAAKQRGTGRSIASWRFSNPEWVAPTEAMKLSTVEVRCDNALPGAPRQVGCVKLRAVPVISYSRTGPWPEIADHIGDAQATGLPGKYGTGEYLTRLTDRSKITQNRDKACPSSLPRPQGKSCDEYPFASTWQGAKYSGGPYSRRMVNARQNTDAGRALNGFYTYSRVLEGDRFLVWIR